MPSRPLKVSRPSWPSAGMTQTLPTTTSPLASLSLAMDPGLIDLSGLTLEPGTEPTALTAPKVTISTVCRTRRIIRMVPSYQEISICGENNSCLHRAVAELQGSVRQGHRRAPCGIGIGCEDA